MRTPSYDQQLLPLRTDQDIEQRVADLIGRANMRQIWMLFLDDDNVQLPLLIPIDGLPALPQPDEAEVVVGGIARVMDQIDASALVIVLERYGGSELTKADTAWLRSLFAACSSASVRVRAVLLSHRRGVRWIGQDDYA